MTLKYLTMVAFCLFGFLGVVMDISAAPEIVFKPMKFKPFHFKPAKFKPFAFKPEKFKPFETHKVIPNREPIHKLKQPIIVKSPKECEECLQAIHPDTDEFLLAAQCYECEASACSISDFKMNPHYQRCKESIKPTLDVILSETAMGG